jgi:hypothetical protein
MRHINSTTLVQWADRAEFAGILPELIRRLIIASCGDMPRITIPAGDSVYKPGVDGKCETGTGGPYVPAQNSYWEFGRNANYRAKCKEDYDKRTLEISTEEKQGASFIFVTPRRWSSDPDREAWIRERKTAGGWKDIYIYDADDLETWLGIYPPVAIWLAARLAVFTANYESAQDYWDRMTNWSDHQISPQFIIAGRTLQQQDVKAFYQQEKGLLEIQATSRQEAICFSIAALIADDADRALQFFARAIIVETETALKEICAQHEGMFIIFDCGDDRSVHQLQIRSNQVIVPVSFKVKPSGLTLPIPHSDPYAEQLTALGVSHQRAYTLARECGKSFSVLYRIFANRPGRVAWHHDHDPAELIPLFLVQRFDEKRAGDREIIDQLYPPGCDAYLEKLKKWSLIFDAPVYQAGQVWRVVSPYDLLHVLAGYITEAHLKNYEAAFLAVFREPDPALELEPQLRIAAAILKKEGAYSRKLQEGLAQTLALLGSHADEAGTQVGMRLDEWVSSVVRQLLSGKQLADWQSIESRLHLLAEAAPDAFLKVLEHTLRNQPQLFSGLFDDADFNIFSPSYHAHLLWALEALAWDKNYLNRVALVLGQLVLLDTGVKTANRPINTLQSVFCIKMPQTYAQAPQRRQALLALARKNPVAAFQLLKALSPGEHRTLIPTYQPFWRLRDEVPQEITWPVAIEDYTFIVEQLIVLAGRKAEQWALLIELIDNYSGDMRHRFIDTLDNMATFEGPVLNLRANMERFIRRHKRHQTLSWALPAAEIERLAAIYERLTLRAIHKYTWYFELEIIEDEDSGLVSMEASERSSHAKRDLAIGEILAEGGLAELLEMAAIVKLPMLLGYHTAHRDQRFAAEAMALLGQPEKYKDQFALGYLHQCAVRKGIAWIAETASSYAKDPGLIRFLCSAPPDAALWDLIESLGTDTDNQYWDQVLKVMQQFLAPTDVERCVSKLNGRSRFASAFNTMRYRLDHVSADAIIRTLEGLISQPAENAVEADTSTHTIKVIFTKLDGLDPDPATMVKLEWAYFQLLNERDHQRPVKYLFQALRDDPSFFARMIAWVGRPEHSSGEAEVAGMEPPAVQRRARNADEVIKAWDLLPGQSANGEIDQVKLEEWCNHAVAACKEKDREQLGYNRIGQLFGQLRDGSQGWPQRQICEILEANDQEEMNRGFYTGVINGHGVKVNLRTPDGGAREKAKAEHYRLLAAGLDASYTVVSGLLLQVARMYEGHGQLIAKEDAQRE